MKWQDADRPTVIEGAINVDDRGALAFCNDVDLIGIRRFYFVSNHIAGRVRAWHGHKKERKLMWPISGATLVGLVPVDNWDRPSRSSEVVRVVLSAGKPQLLVVPPGFANGTMSLTGDAVLMVLSTLTLDESVKDDFRFEPRYWDPWQVVER